MISHKIKLNSVSTWLAFLVATILVNGIAPDKQLRHFTSLINSAILAEAVITNRTDIWSVTTDWMIIESIPNDKRWIATLELNPRYAEIQEMLQQFGPLHDVIRNGYNQTIPIDQLDKIVELIKLLDSFPEFRNFSQYGLEIVKNFDTQSMLDLKDYNAVVKYMEFLPRAVPFLREASTNQHLNEHLQSGLDFINVVKNIDVNKINRSLHLCREFDGSSRSFNPCEDLYIEIKNVTKVPNWTDIENSAYFLRAYHYAKSGLNLKMLLDTKPEIGRMRGKLQELLSGLKSFSKLPDKRRFAEIFQTINMLKKNGAHIEALTKALNVFCNISEVISKISNYDAPPLKKHSKLNNRFASYLGFPQGIGSLREMLTVLGPEGRIPSRFRVSKLPERVVLMKNWMGKVQYLLDNTRGLIDILPIYSNVQNLENFTKNTDIVEIDVGQNGLSQFLTSLSVRDVSEVIVTLIDIENRMEFFENSTWAMDLYNNMVGMLLLDGIEVWDELFWLMPKVFQFFNQAMEDFREIREENHNIETLPNEKKSELHVNITSHFDSYINLIPEFMQLSLAIKGNQKKLRVDVGKIDNMKEKLSVLNSMNNTGSSSNDKLPMDKLQSGLDVHAKLKETIESITDQNITQLEKYVHGLETVEDLKKSIKPLPDSFNLEAIKSLLGAINNSKPADFSDFSKAEPNGFLSNLLSDEPFGSDLLHLSSICILEYEYLIKDIGFSNLRSELETFRQTYNNSVSDFLDGIEYIEITADPLNVYSLFADELNLPERIKKMREWVERALAEEHSYERKYIEQRKYQYGTIYTLVKRIVKPLDQFLKILNNKIDFLFRVLQKGKHCNRQNLTHPDCIEEAPPSTTQSPDLPETHGYGIERRENEVEKYRYRETIFIVLVIFFCCVSPFACSTYVVFGKRHEVEKEQEKPKTRKKKRKVKGSSSDLTSKMEEGVNDSSTPEAEEVDSKESKLEKESPKEKQRSRSEKAAEPKKSRKEKSSSSKKKEKEEGKKEASKKKVMGLVVKEGKVRDFRQSLMYYADWKICYKGAVKSYETLISQVTDEYNSLPSIDGKQLNKQDTEMMINQKDNLIAMPHWKHNLVKLPSGRYIPASKIGGFKDRKFIAAQAPLTVGMEKFFEMLFVEDVKVIMQMCTTEELVYEPPKEEAERAMEPYANVASAGIYKVKKAKLSVMCGVQNVEQSMLTITDTKTGKSIDVVHLVCQSWPDSSVPDNHDIVVKLLLLVNSFTPKGSTCLVHCKAGLGRTMTFVTIARCVEKMENEEGPFDILDVATQMRKERNMGIQNVLQYLFIMGVLTKYLENVKKKDLKKFWVLYDKAFDCLYKTRQVMIAEILAKNAKRKPDELQLQPTQKLEEDECEKKVERKKEEDDMKTAMSLKG